MVRLALVSEQAASPAVSARDAPARCRERHVAELARALAAAGHEVRVYARADGCRESGRQVLADLTVEQVAPGPAGQIPEHRMAHHASSLGERLAASWREAGWTPDVVHGHYWLGGLAAVAAGHLACVPVALTYHEIGQARHRYLAEAARSACRITLERQLGRTVDLVITQSCAEVAELARLGVPRHRMALVPGGIDPQWFTPIGPVAPRRPLPRRIVAVGSARRLEGRRGFPDTIQALCQVPDAEMVLVGGPARQDLGRDPDVCHLHTLARDCGVADRVRFVGRIPGEQMPGWYRSADLVACTSWYEPFPTTAIEAMASGVPVVATAVGGLRDAVVDGVTGVLVPPHQPTALARAIRGMLASPLRRMEYAAAGMDRARQCYAWDRVVDRLQAHYHQLVTAGRR